jgi:hypothetical protein
MADNVAITAGSGTTISTDERTISSVAQHVQRVVPLGGSTIVAGHAEISNAHAQISPAAETQHCVTIVNYQTVPVYVGPHEVATTDGFRLDPGASLTLHTTAEVFGITAAAYTAAGEDDKVHYISEQSA